MRTTLTISPEVGRRIKQLLKERDIPLKQLIDQLLRAGLEKAGEPAPRRRFRVQPVATGFAAGVDPLHLNALNAEIDGWGIAP
jgi:hypothetical protein